MSDPETTAPSSAKDAAALHNTKASGEQVLRGHQAVDPSGHLVLIPGERELPDDGWRWATADDVAKSAAAAKALDAKNKPPAPSGGPLK